MPLNDELRFSRIIDTGCLWVSKIQYRVSFGLCQEFALAAGEHSIGNQGKLPLFREVKREEIFQGQGLFPLRLPTLRAATGGRPYNQLPQPFVFVPNASSVFIRVHPRPEKFGVLSPELGVKGNKALFSTLGSLGTFGCGSNALSLSVSNQVFSFELRRRARTQNFSRLRVSPRAMGGIPVLSRASLIRGLEKPPIWRALLRVFRR
jgi:hypothetical protein